MRTSLVSLTLFYVRGGTSLLGQGRETGLPLSKYTGLRVKSEFAVLSWERTSFSPLGLILTESLRLTQSHMAGKELP